MDIQTKQQRPHASQPLHTVLTYFPSFIAFLLIALSPQLIGTSPDSIVYVNVARSLLNGEGLSHYNWITSQISPLTHYPPVYPILLSTFSLNVFDPLISAKWFHALIYALNVFLIIKILQKYCANYWFPIIGGFMIGISEFLFQVHIMAWSEPFFLTCMLGSFLLIDYMQVKQSNWVLINLGSVVGAAIMTRYAGLAFAAAFGVWILFWYPNEFKRRINALFLYCLPILIILAVWFGRNYSLNESVANRTISIHLISWEHFQSAMFTFSNMLLPGIRATNVAGLLLLLIWAVAIVYVVKTAEPIPYILKISGVTAVFYITFLITSISLIDAYTPLNNRILSPLLLIIFLWLFAAADTISPKLQTIPFVRLLPLSVFLIYAVLLLVGNGRSTANYYQYGKGFTSTGWQASQLIEQIEGLQSTATIYSNGPDVIYLLTGRLTNRIPNHTFPTTQLKNEDFAHERTKMVATLQEEKGYYVNFNAINRTHLSTSEAILSQTPYELIFKSPEGEIYLIKAK